MTVHFRRMAVVGVGLMGASVALACRQKKIADEVVGIDREGEVLSRALEQGIIDRSAPALPRGVAEADCVLLATPVGGFEGIAREMGPFLAPGCIVTDVGSVKGRLVKKIEGSLPRGRRFVGGHPIAGRETSGIQAASPSLFEGTRCILTPTEQTDPEALRMVRGMWETIGSTVVLMDPATHDQILAAVSHLPHLVAFSLVNTLLTLRIREEDLFSYSGGGLRDFTRVAGSSAEMWRDICLENRENILQMIDSFQKTLAEMRRIIEKADGPGLMSECERAKGARGKIL